MTAWISCALVALGFGLTTSRTMKVRLWGFIVSLLANLGMILVGLGAGLMAFVLLSIFFVTLSIVGICHNWSWRKPA